MWIPLLDAVDTTVNQLPLLLWIIVWGALVGGLSMLVYWKCSPQERLGEISQRAGDARQALQRFDGDELGVYRQLAMRAVGLSMTQLRLVLLPTALAVLPIALVAWCIDYRYDPGTHPLWGDQTSWWNSWATVFWGALGLSALAVKLGFRIK